MATSTSAANHDHLPTRPALRTRPYGSALGGSSVSPRSPRTPLLGRSISSQFGSPGNSFRTEYEEWIVYELGARHLASGFSGESRPRCVVKWTPDMGRRVGDYRAYLAARPSPGSQDDSEAWGEDHEFYHVNTRSLNLGLVENKLERTVRNIHTDYLQLDSKPRKAILVIPSLLPTPIIEVMLKVLFNHYAQPSAVTLMTTPLLACVGSGHRNALVVEIGWEETVITAIGEYKQVYQRRSVRAGKMLTQEMARTIDGKADDSAQSDQMHVNFGIAEDVTERIAWCRSMSSDHDDAVHNRAVQLPRTDSTTTELPFRKLSDPAETVFFDEQVDRQDDHNLPLPALAHRVLLDLPLDLRSLAISRIVITGGSSQVPGLKHRLLQELSTLCSTRGWNPVHSYGKATTHRARVLQERNADTASGPHTEDRDGELPSTKKTIENHVPHSDRIHDDIKDPTSMKAENRAVEGKDSVPEVVKGVVRGVETVGAWSAASLIARLRVKGVHEVEREDFLKHGHDTSLIALLRRLHNPAAFLGSHIDEPRQRPERHDKFEMRILDAGTEPVPNQQVLDFIHRKRAQHKREEAEDRVDHLSHRALPANFVSALNKHEEYLKNAKFGYKKSPKYYDQRLKGMRAFQLRFAQLVLDPIGEKYKAGGEKAGLSEDEKSAQWEAEEEGKELAETELLGLYNTTPACVEQLQTMIDNWAERFTDEEMDSIQQALQETYLSGGDPEDVLKTDRTTMAQVQNVMKATEKGGVVANGQMLAMVNGAS
nr:actin-related protein 10 [Quercus suber]